MVKAGEGRLDDFKEVGGLATGSFNAEALRKEVAAATSQLSLAKNRVGAGLEDSEQSWNETGLGPSNHRNKREDEFEGGLSVALQNCLSILPQPESPPKC
jgi:hypothetical protein